MEIKTITNTDKVSLEELFNNYEGEDLTTIFEWDNLQGKELI